MCGTGSSRYVYEPLNGKLYINFLLSFFGSTKPRSWHASQQKAMSNPFGFVTIFSHAEHLAQWLDTTSFLICLGVCRSWRLYLQQHPLYRFLWTRLIKERWILFTCDLGNYYKIKEDISRTTFIRILHELLEAVSNPVIFDRQTWSVKCKSVTSGWSGFNNGRGPFSDVKVIQSFKDRGYKLTGSYQDRFTFTISNRGRWVFEKFRWDVLVHHTQQEQGRDGRRIYFDKCSMSVVSLDHVTHGWSGYNNGCTQKSIHHVILDFVTRVRLN